MSMIKPETVGSTSIPTKQNIQNNQSNAVMGLPFNRAR